MVENVSKEQSRNRNIVRIGLIQNKIHADTSAPVQDQFMAIYNRIEKMIDAAGAAGVNVLCLQEAWTMPFAFCTREKQPWMEFAECAQTGQRFVLGSPLYFFRINSLENEGWKQVLTWKHLLLLGNIVTNF